MKYLIILLTLVMFGCSSPNPESITDLREYSINDLHVVVGIGKWEGDKFVIQSYDGNTWDVPKGVPLYESAISLESFKKVTK